MIALAVSVVVSGATGCRNANENRTPRETTPVAKSTMPTMPAGVTGPLPRTYPEGKAEWTYPDGRVKTQWPDGSVTWTSPRPVDPNQKTP